MFSIVFQIRQVLTNYDLEMLSVSVTGSKKPITAIFRASRKCMEIMKIWIRNCYIEDSLYPGIFIMLNKKIPIHLKCIFTAPSVEYLMPITNLTYQIIEHTHHPNEARIDDVTYPIHRVAVSQYTKVAY